MASVEDASRDARGDAVSVRLGPYELGPNDTQENGIYTGDAMELAKAIPDGSADVALVDPPYGVSWRCAWRTASQRFDAIPGDDEINTNWLKDLYRVLKPISAAFIFTRWDVMQDWRLAIESEGFTVKNCIVWDKGFHGCGDLFGAFAPQHEMALFAVKGKFRLHKRLPDVVRVNRVNPNALVHPAQKPVGLMAHLLEASASRGNLVVDWFSGSGTVQVACKQLGRSYLAFEIDPATAEMARERVRNTQPPLFVASAPRQLSLDDQPRVEPL